MRTHLLREISFFDKMLGAEIKFVTGEEYKNKKNRDNGKYKR